jgi:hypothetical protein
MGICERYNESLGYTRRGEFLNQLSDCNLISYLFICGHRKYFVSVTKL